MNTPLLVRSTRCLCGMALAAALLSLLPRESPAQQPPGSGYYNPGHPPRYEAAPGQNAQPYYYPPPQQESPPQGYPQPQYQQPAPGYGYPPQGYAPAPAQPQYVSPFEFLPTFGRRFGEMFRKLFYGDGRHDAYPPQPLQGSGIHNLDSAPPPYSSHYSTRPPPPSMRPPVGTPPYQTPSAQRYSPPQPPPSSSRTSPAPSTRMPSTSSRSSSAPTTKKSAGSGSKQSVIQESPPSSTSKSSKSSSSSPQTEYAPLPGLNSPPKTISEQDDTSSSTKSAANTGAFLKGRRTSKPGRVISPYPPYQELDVTGLSSGSLALDPTTQKVFEVP